MSSALECVMNGRAAAPPASVCKHRGFDFEKPAAFQSAAYRADDGDPLPRHRARLRAHDQVDVALPYPRLFAHLLVRDGQRPQRLGRHLPGIGQHGQFAAP